MFASLIWTHETCVRLAPAHEKRCKITTKISLMQIFFEFFSYFYLYISDFFCTFAVAKVFWVQ